MPKYPARPLFGPKGVPHAFTVDSGPARLLFVLSPAGFEDLIREMGEPRARCSIASSGGSKALAREPMAR